MSILRRINKSCEYIGMVQTLLIALQFLWLWLFAQSADAYKVYNLSILMGFEFIMVHSGVVMAVMPKKYSILIFFPLYGLFAWAFHTMLADGDNIVLVIYLTTVLNRMRFAFFNVDKQMVNATMLESLIAFSCYFFLLIIVTVGSSLIPPFSLGSAFTDSVAYRSVVKIGGMFTEKPCMPICLGFLYYSFLTFVSYVRQRSR